MKKGQIIFGLWLGLISQWCFAEHMVITGKTIIDKPTVIKNAVIDINHGYFYIDAGASLEITDSVVNGSLSTHDTSLMEVVNGHLILKNNQFHIFSDDLPQNPIDASIYSVIKIARGQAVITQNTFFSDRAYAVSLLMTDHFYTDHFIINNNHIHNFHGAFFLTNTHHAKITNNQFTNISLSSIFMAESDNALIENNDILFPGNNNVGDGMDIIHSSDIEIKKNFISSGSCYSLVILGSKNIMIDRNRIVSGITYAVFIKSSLQDFNNKEAILLNHLLGGNDDAWDDNQNITITHNYLAQNRYGLSASNVNGFIVKDNIFIQRFANNETRKFWTDNHILLKEINELVWENNFYKEAFSQELTEQDNNALKFVLFPISGGVDL